MSRVNLAIIGGGLVGASERHGTGSTRLPHPRRARLGTQAGGSHQLQQSPQTPQQQRVPHEQLHGCLCRRRGWRQAAAAAVAARVRLRAAARRVLKSRGADV